MSGTPILSNIETAMIALIKSMTTTGGYNFNWDTVNEIDLAIGSFPRALIDSPVESSTLGKGTNQDTLNGQHSDAYTNEAIFTIQIRGELSTPSTSAYFTIRDTLRRALDDLKMLFGIHNTVSDTCDTIMYQDAQIVYIQRNDVMRPAELKTSWKCVYSQDRETPSQYASS
jgi:hypothetical protein